MFDSVPMGTSVSDQIPGGGTATMGYGQPPAQATPLPPQSGSGGVAIHEVDPSTLPHPVMQGGSTPNPDPQGKTPGMFDSVPMVQPPVPTRGQSIGDKIDAVVRGAADTLTFGMAPRIVAGLETATGLGGKFGDYTANLAQERGVDTADVENQPGYRMAGQLAGGLALPVGAAGEAATLAGRAGLGALAGGAQGALYGAGSSPDLTNVGDVAKNAALGGAIGGVTGGAVPALASGAGAALRATGIPALIQGARNPLGAAGAAVRDVLDTDMTRNADLARRGLPQKGLSPQEWQAAHEAGAPVVLADLGGVRTQRLARAAADMSPEAEATIRDVTEPRFASQQARIAEALPEAGNSTETITRLQDIARASNRPAYRAFYDRTANGVWNPELATMSASPTMQDAIRATTRTAKDVAVGEGHVPPRQPFIVNADGTLAPNHTPDGGIIYPSGQFWDYVQRELRDKETKAIASGARNEARIYGNLRRQLNANVDAASGGTFAEARGGAARFLGQESALEAGQQFAKGTGRNSDFQRDIARLHPGERELFAHGYASDLLEKINAQGANRDAAIHAIFTAPKLIERHCMALGQAGATRLEVAARVETIMQNLNKALGGSQTAKNLANQAMASGIVGTGTFAATGDYRQAAGAAAVLPLLKHVLVRSTQGVNARVMEHIAELLVSNNPNDLARAISSIAQNRQALAGLRRNAARVTSALIPQEINATKGQR